MTVCRLLSYQDSFSPGLDIYFHRYFLKEKNELVTCMHSKFTIKGFGSNHIFSFLFCIFTLYINAEEKYNT